MLTADITDCKAITYIYHKSSVFVKSPEISDEEGGDEQHEAGDDDRDDAHINH